MGQNNITLYFKGKAISKDNEKLISKYPSKKTGRYFMFTSTKYKIYEKDLRKQARAQLPTGFKPYEGNVWVKLIFYFKNKVHTDICNLPKSIIDAMQKSKVCPKGILWKDDKQVWLDKVFPVYDKDKPEGFTMEVRTVEIDNICKLYNPMFIIDTDKNTIKEVGTNNIKKLRKTKRYGKFESFKFEV